MPYVTLYTDWADLDSKLFRSINGDLGGAWTPSTPIILGGDGLSLHGPLIVDYGGSLKTLNGARYMIGDNDHPRFKVGHVFRSRKIVTPCSERMSTPKFHWIFDQTTGGIQSIACSILYNGGTQLLQPSFITPLQVHNGGRLTSVALTFIVKGARSSIPAATPKLRIIRVDKDGNAEVLQSVAAGADANGYISFATPTNGPSWVASNALKTFTYTCDQNNTIDTSLYMYFAQVVEEAGLTSIGTFLPRQCDGTSVREQKTDVKLVFTTNQAITGAGGGLATGDRALLTANTIPQQNGIWIVNTAGAWSRAGDLASGLDFTTNFLVNETGSYTVWECTAPLSSSAITLSTDSTGSVISFQRRTPKGNLYLAFTASFDSIVDMRPQ